MGHQYRFTLIHDSGTKEISEPEGWADIKITLERDKEYFGVFELFETPMTFYGKNQTYDGGYDFLESINTTFGPDAQVHIYIEIKPNIGDAFESFFTGLLDNSARKKIDSRKIQIPVIQNDFIAKFKARSSTPVNINSTKDLGDVVMADPTSGVNEIQLTAQLIQQLYSGYLSANYITTNFSGGGGTDKYHIIEYDKEDLSEIDSKFSYPMESSPEIPFEKFALEFGGLYRIQFKTTMNIGGGFIIAHQGSTLPYIKIYYKINGNTPVEIPGIDRFVDVTETANDGTSTIHFSAYVTDYAVDVTLSLNKNDAIRIYAENIANSGGTPVFYSRNGLPHIPQFNFQGYWDPSTGDFPIVSSSGGAITNGMVWAITQSGNMHGRDVDKDWIIRAIANSPGQDISKWYVNSKEFFEGLQAFGDTSLQVTANTTSQESTVNAFFIHDVAQKILERITEQSSVSPFYSEYLGGIHTLGSYLSDGCATHLMVTQGLQLRQYTLASKAFSISFNDWWTGVNPILNLGLCYDTIDDNLVIRVEDKAFFFDDDIVLYLDYVNVVDEDYDLENIFNKIKIGYTTWKSEDVSGIDDPQTTHQYSTVFKTVGKEIDIESGFIAASLAIEQTRRTTIQKSQDYKFDNNVFVISVQTDEASSPPGAFLPKLDEEFDSVSNLFNSSTRYNLELTPLRNLLRWGNFLNGCLQRNLDTPYKFTYGEGNYAMVSDYSGSAPAICLNKISDPLSEGQDINLTGIGYGPGIGHLFQPIVFTFTHPLSYSNYKLIRDNKHKAIGISETNSGHITCFIKKIEYDINKSKAIFTLWKR